MPTTIRNTDILFNDSSTQNTAATGFGFKNRIINGAMVIDQRNAGTVTVNTTAGVYGLDRWLGRTPSAAGVFTMQGSTTAPTGFRNSLLCTVTTAATPGATDIYFLQQRIEGFNVADFMLGTANAQTFTVSFWVRSSVTGTFGASVGNNVDQSYPFSFTINAANTFEQKTVTIPGSTSGTWNTSTGIGLILNFSLGAGSSVVGTANTWGNYPYAPTGSVNLIATNGATFFITGVQLERGSTATSFDYRPYGTELMLCQRYASRVGQVNGYATSATNVRQTVTYPVQMRATPTVGGMSGAFRWSVPGLYDITSTSTPTIATAEERIATIDQTVSGASAGSNTAISNGGSVLFSAEL